MPTKNTLPEYTQARAYIYRRKSYFSISVAVVAGLTLWQTKPSDKNIELSTTEKN